MGKTQPGKGLLHRAAKPFVVFVERFYPDSFVFVIILTFVTFAASFAATSTAFPQAVTAWGGGMSSLMAFTAQIGITLITAHALASTDAIQTALRWIARLPTKDWQAYAMIAALAGLAALIAWPLGLVVGATLARRVALEGAERGIVLDYPLLVASAYSGFVIWHMGYSGTAPLFVATPDHALQDQVGVIPVTRTIFASWNIALAIFTLIVVSITCALMRPPPDQARIIGSMGLAKLREKADSQQPEAQTAGERLAQSRIGSLLLGVLLAAYLYFWFTEHGFSLNLNIVNWSFLAGGLLLARSPAHYVSLALEGGRSLGSLLLQYPFYAGIMGLLAGSGLMQILSGWFAANATATTLPFWAFLSGGLVNLFVPSGGGQWAIQGPIFIEAAKTLNVDPAIIVMAIAYGDQWTNMIQPFWAIPLLAIAGLKVGDVLGYTFITLIVTFFIFSGGLFLVSMAPG